MLTLKIAGVTVAIALPGPEWLPPLAPRIGRFAAPVPLLRADADLVLHVVLERDLAAAPGGEPRVEEDAAGLHLRHDQFHGHLPPTGPARLAIYQPGDAPDDLTYIMVIDSFLRMGLAQLLASRGGLMLHAAGIATAADDGYVFFGPSGSGKTTVCQLSSPRFRVLCDEIIAIRPQAQGLRLYGTPFCGAWGESLAEDVTLREMFHLRQAPLTRRVKPTPVEALRAVLESAVVYHRSPAFLDQVLEVASALIQQVPVNQLEFVAKETLWETVLAPLPIP